MSKSSLLLLVLSSVLAVFLSLPAQAHADDPTHCDSPTVDVTPYIAPKCSGSCPAINASAVTSTDSNIGDVNNYVEYVNANTFKQHSNQNHFLYQVSGGNINFMQDSVWGGFYCTNGKKAMYRVYDGSSQNWGAHQFPTQMSCAVPHTYSAFIKSYEYDPAVETQFDVALNACPVDGQGPAVASDTNELFFQGKATCNGHSNLDIIGIKNVGGAGAGEVDFYCKGYGLCAFYQTLDFSNPANDPTKWTASTDVCDLKSQVADYYLYPIKGLPTATTTGDSNTILSDLANQGYQSQCTAPTISVHAVEGGDIQLYLNQIAAGAAPVERTVNAKEIVDYTDSQVPLLRSSNPLATLKASLEDFWGYQDTTLSQPATLEETLNSSFLYSKLTLQDQCQYKVNILQTINNMCSQLKDPNTCALYQSIPNAGSYTTKNMLSAFNATGLNCSQVGLGQYTSDQKPVVDALLKTPLYLDKAYRLAFLVIVSELKAKGNPSNFFDFLRDPGGTATPRDEVRVVAFKIPDIGTNRPTGALNYQDPLDITRDITLSQDEANANETQLQSQNNAIASGGIKASGGIIDCDGTTTCADPLVRALVSVVNNTGQSCDVSADDLKYEPSSTIGTTGDLTPTEPDFGDNTNPSKYLLQSDQNPTPADTSTNQKGIFNFLSDLTIGKDDGTSSQITTYLVYPVGHELNTVEDALMAYVDLNADKDIPNDPTYRDYFKVNGVNQNLTSSQGSVSFVDSAPCTSTAPGIPCSSVKQATTELGADQSDPGARILGGRLGFLTRYIQQTIYDIVSPQLVKLQGCKTTEQFLTGQCNGVVTAANVAPAGACTIQGGIIKDPANPSNWIGGEEIKSQALKNLIASAGQKYNVPVQVLMSTLWLENCRGAADICDMTDAQIQPYLAPGVEYAPNCPGGGASTQPFTGIGKGVYGFFDNICVDTNKNGVCDADEKLVDWGQWRENPTDDICNIKDSTYAAAKLLSYDFSRSFNTAPPAAQWTLQQAQLTLSRWAANVDSCDAHPFAHDYCQLVARLWDGDAKVTTTCNLN